jgi:hypothetical protein
VLATAFDFISKKAGKDFTPEQDEKITDGIRGAYEKASGYVYAPTRTCKLCPCGKGEEYKIC